MGGGGVWREVKFSSSEEFEAQREVQNQRENQNLTEKLKFRR
jgi:hypothetical protein